MDILSKTRELSSIPYAHEQSKEPVSDSSKGQKQEKTEDTQDSSNSFDQANFSEIQKALEDLADASDTKETPVEGPESVPQYTTGPLDDPAELHFAALCLVNDMIKLRRIVRSLWRIYQERKTGIIPITLCINMAIELVRDLEHDFQERYPDRQDYGAILDRMSFLKCVDGDRRCSFAGAPYGSGANLPEVEAKMLMIHTFFWCNTMTERMRGDRFPVLTPRTYKGRDLSTKWSEKSYKDQMTDDNIVLYEAVPDLSLLSWQDGRILGEDE